MKTIAFLLLPLTLLLASCSTSRITDSYTNNRATAPAKRILVLGMFSQKNDRAKRAMESELVKNLNKFGFDAVSATDDFGQNAFKGMTEQQAIQKLQDEGIQNVITINLVDKDKSRRYVPGTPGYAPGFYGYYNYYSPWGYQPGYTQVTTNYVFETNLYDVANNSLIYSAQSKTADAGNMATLANDYARSIVRDMKRKNILG